jgi:hypothetical protein
MTFIHMGKIIARWKFPRCAIESHFFNQIAKRRKKKWGRLAKFPWEMGE